jgi:hypothetical protein
MASDLTYKTVAKRILKELDTNLEHLPESKLKLFSEVLSTFYLFNIKQELIQSYPDQEQESLYLVTLGVLANHFIDHPPPIVPRPSIDLSAPPPSPALSSTDTPSLPDSSSNSPTSP